MNVFVLMFAGPSYFLSQGFKYYRMESVLAPHFKNLAQSGSKINQSSFLFPKPTKADLCYTGRLKIQGKETLEASEFVSF